MGGDGAQPPAGSAGAGLHLVRAIDVEFLATALASQLSVAPPEDPFAPIEVAVPSVGMARWLSQRLSHHLGATGGEGGVAAGLTLPFLGSVVSRTLTATLDGEDQTDPWLPERLQWSVAELLDSLPGDAVYAPLAAHLQEGTVRVDRRRLPLAHRIADLFDRYALHRPAMVQRWHAGQDVDAVGAPLPEGLRWQPALWRELVRRLERPSPDRRLAAAIAALRGAAEGGIARPDLLPGPVSVFGVLGMPSGHLELLAALAERTRVELYLLAPVTAWWAGGGGDDGQQRPAHPLLAASGLAAWQAGSVVAERVLPRAARVTDLAPAAADQPAGRHPGGQRLLRVLQEDLRGDRRRSRRGARAAVELDPADTSVQVHACHGPVRQLEVLREVLLGLLEDDPGLEPRDIVVLTPDIATYAPLVPSAFPRGPTDADGGDLPVLPVRVADRTVRPGNRAAEALEALLALVTARVGGSEVLDLLGMPALRARFGLGSEDLATLADWVLGTGISWGIDRAHRRALVDLDDPAHTWSAGLDRLALGAAVPDDGQGMVGGVVPYDDVEGASVEQLGRVLIATDAVFAALASLREPRPRAAWCTALHAALTDLCDPGEGPGSDPSLAEDVAAVRDALTRLLDPGAAADGPPGPHLTLEEVRWLLDGGLGPGGGSTPYGTGAVTVSGLVPLRNLPHRVVCLVGMDDGVLPGAPQEHGFDLLSLDPRPGDPDPRIEDRQLFLDALLAARDHLVITYTGHDPRSNEVTQPSVPVSELLDVLEETAVVADGAVPPRDRVIVDHPLQPHSARYFASTPRRDRAPDRAFDPHQLAAARAARGDRQPPQGFLARSLPLPGIEVLDPSGVELDAVVAGLQHPLRTLLQRRLGLHLGEDDRRLEDRDPTELGGLQRWQVSQALLEQQLGEGRTAGWRERLLASGTVPVGGLGVLALEGVEERVAAVHAAFAARPGAEQQLPIDLPVDLPAGSPGASTALPAAVRLTGTAALLGDDVVTAQVSTIRAKHQLAAWVRLLAVAAVRPEPTPRALLIGPPARGSVEATTYHLDPLALVGEGEELSVVALHHLGGLLQLYLQAHVAAVPLLPETARALVVAGRKGSDDPSEASAVRTAWEGRPGGRGRSPVPGERDDTYVAQALGAEAELQDVLAGQPGTQAAMAAVWEPILDAEVAP